MIESTKQICIIIAYDLTARIIDTARNMELNSPQFESSVDYYLNNE